MVVQSPSYVMQLGPPQQQKLPDPNFPVFCQVIFHSAFASLRDRPDDQKMVNLINPSQQAGLGNHLLTGF